MERKIRDVPNYEKGRMYYVGSGGRVMSRPMGKGGKAREEDMAPIVRKPKHMYFVRDGALFERPMGK